MTISTTADQHSFASSADFFRQAIEAAPTGMMMIDDRGDIVLINQQVETMLGYSRDELIGQPVEMLVPERFRARHPGFRNGFFADPRARPMGGGRDLFGLRKDGTEVPIEIGLNPLSTPDGAFVLSSIVDITERKRAAGQIQASLREKETLLKEVHHRVKNNLQVISSLINMQVRQVTDASARAALQECQSRVQAIGLIHEKLYQFEDYSRVPFSEYVRSLASTIFQATGLAPSAVALDLQVETSSLAIDKAIPCALILNELITNALKHAFRGERGGVIHVALRRDSDADLTLSVTDDGVGMPIDFDIEKSNTLGMQLVSTLVEQLEGRLEISREDSGTTFRITFPTEAHS